MRADFQHLRRWRKSVEQAHSYTFKAVITVIVTGFVGAVWLGVKVMLVNDQHTRPLAASCKAAVPGGSNEVLKSGRCTGSAQSMGMKTKSRTRWPAPFHIL
jgi:hypothetical protein